MTECVSCAHLRRDKEWRPRCHSPQLHAMGFPGILINFERDATPELGREGKTMKCGPEGRNFIAGDGV